MKLFDMLVPTYLMLGALSAWLAKAEGANVGRRGGCAPVRALARFDPVVVSSLAAGLDADGSDLDVVCDLRQPGFVERARAAYGTRHGFAARPTADRTVVTFFGEELQVELVDLVGEARPIEARSAYRHAVAQRRLVGIGGGPLAARVRQLRRDFALKTEPALATALDLAGDPYKTIARLASAPTTSSSAS